MAHIHMRENKWFAISNRYGTGISHNMGKAVNQGVQHRLRLMNHLGKNQQYRRQIND